MHILCAKYIQEYYIYRCLHGMGYGVIMDFNMQVLVVFI